MALRIQRNEFISGLRRQRPSVPVDTAIAESLSHPAHQDSGLIMREFVNAFAEWVPRSARHCLLAMLEGFPYEVIAAHTNETVGRVKSGISRARDTLERLLLEGDEPSAVDWRGAPGRARTVGRSRRGARCLRANRGFNRRVKV